MNGKNRCLAWILSVTLLLTSSLSEFGYIFAVGTDKTDEGSDYYKIAFDNIDVTELDAQGFTSTKYSRNTTTSPFELSGETNRPASEYWFSGNDEGTPYYKDDGTKVSGVTAENVGLKPRTNSNDDRYYLYSPYEYESFKASAQIYWGAFTGIVFGEKNTNPTKSTDSAVRVYFNGNNIQINGAVDLNSGKATGGKVTKSGNVLVFSPNSFTKTVKTVYTLNVKVENGILSVYLSNNAAVLTVELSETYKSGPIGVVQRAFGGDNGGIKSLDICDISDYATTVFDNIDVNTLDEKGFSSKKFTKLESVYELVETAEGISEHWFSGNGQDTPYYNNSVAVSGIKSENVGIKPKTNSDADRYLLVTPYTYENYSISEEIYYGVQTGLVLGKKDTFPNGPEAKATAIYFNNNRIQISGGVDLNSAKASGKNCKVTVYNKSMLLFDFDKKFSAKNGNIYTLNARVSDGVLTVWVGGYDGVLTVNLSSDYESGAISVMSRKFGGDNGGVKSVSVRNLTAVRADAVTAKEGDGFAYDFGAPAFNTSALGTDFVSYYFESADSAKEYKANALWSIGEVGGNNYLKPTHKVNGSKYTLLTCDKYIFKNPDITAEYLSNTAQYSIIVAPEGKLNSPETGVKIWVESTGTVKISGTVDAGSSQATGGMVKLNGSGTSVAGFALGDYVALNAEYTLRVKINGDILYTWMEEYPDYVISVRLTENYKGGAVSLCSTGNNSGGFGSFSAYESAEPQDDDGKTFAQSFSSVASLSALKDFTAYTLGSAENAPVETDISEAFALKNGKLRSNRENSGKDDRTEFSILTYVGKRYRNFEVVLNFEQHRMLRYGIMFGTEPGEFAYTIKGTRLQGNGGAFVYTEAEGYRNIRGSLYNSSMTSAKESLSRTKDAEILKSFCFFGSDVMKNVQKSAIHTMKIRVVGDSMTVTVDNDESSRVTVKLADYDGGYISLVTNANAAGSYGAFDYLSITELDDDAQLGTDEPSVSKGYETLEQVDGIFDAYYLSDAKESKKLEKVDIKDRWWISNGGILTRTKSASGYSVTQDVDVLTYAKQKYTDFEMSYTYQQNWLRMGVIIGGEQGSYPVYYENGKITADNGALIFLEAEGYTNVQGNIKNMSAKSDKLYRISNPAPEGFKDSAGSVVPAISAKKEHTLKIVVKNKKLYVFIDAASAPSCYVELGASYSGGYISIFAHTTSGFGFKDFTVSDEIKTDLTYASGSQKTENGITADFDCSKFDDSDFTTYYLEDVKNNPDGVMEKRSFYDCWTIVNGKLKCNNIASGTDVSKVAALTYNKKLTDFVVTYDYQKTPLRLMMIFGAEMGKHPISAKKTTERINSGALIYPENDLGAGGGIVALGNIDPLTSKHRPIARKTMLLSGYHQKGNWNSNIGKWHTMTVAVINKQVYIYLDSYGMIASFTLSDSYAGGYVSIATSGNGGAFDNLTVTDLSGMPLNSVMSVTNPDDITVKTGTDISSLSLPSSVKATLKNGKTAQVPVSWEPVYYDGNTAGVYKFTAVLSDTADAVNVGKVAAVQEIRVSDSLPENRADVRRWDFNTQNDLNDFKAYYLKDAESGYITENIPKWYISGVGRLCRDPFRTVEGDQYNNIAILTYTGEKYENFELEVDYTQSWKRMMVLFGSEKAGEYINLNDIYATTNPVAAFVEMEGTRNFIGNLRNANFDSNDKEKINNSRESGIRAEDYYDKKLVGGNAGKVHTMKVRVVGDQASLWVDDTKTPYTATLTDYDGGYISLVSTTKDGFFDNLKITRLNARGEAAVSERDVLANGASSVTVDSNASTALELKKNDAADNGAENSKNISVLMFVLGGAVILSAAALGTGAVLITRKKYRKQ